MTSEGATPPAGSTQPAAGRAADAGPRARRFRRFTPASLNATIDGDAQLRLGLQRRSRLNLRAHIRRAVIRMSVLIAADVGTFYVMRALIRAVRDSAVLGTGIARFVSDFLPRGYMNGWQFAIALLLGLLVTGNYGPGDARRDVSRLFLGCALAAALPLWMAVWTRGLEPVLFWYVSAVVLVWLGLVAERLSVNRVVALVRPPERDAPRTILVGPADQCRRLREAGPFASARDYRVLGFVDTETPAAADALAGLEALGRVIHETQTESVVMCGYLEAQPIHDIADLALSAECELLSIPRSLSAAGVRPTLVWRGGEPLVSLTAPALKAQQLIVKRMVDVVAAVAGLVFLSPVLGLIAGLIKLDSKGPALFRQQRVGFGGRLFGMVKFRTMVDGADDQKSLVAHLNRSGDERLFKVPNDPRITRLGGFLRRWSLDELPQLWNVLRGDMSLVGPRPFFPADLEYYEYQHFDRLGAKPGITGLWQVSGRSAVTDFEEVVRFDREYILNWTLGLDIRILLLTVPAVFSKRGAY